MLSVYEKKQPFGTPKEDKDPDDPSFLDPDGPGAAANENPPSQVSEDQVLTPPLRPRVTSLTLRLRALSLSASTLLPPCTSTLLPRPLLSL